MELGRLLGDRSCRVYTSDQRVRVLATGLSTYPDVAVACGDVQYDPDDSCAITNPRLLVEVLSDSTELYDRTGKFRHYKRIPSLRDYVLVSQHEARIEVYSRNDAGRWLHDEGVAGGTVVLTSLDAALDVDRVYRNVVLDPSVALR
jgi:Uma2 family endonuclease